MTLWARTHSLKDLFGFQACSPAMDTAIQSGNHQQRANRGGKAESYHLCGLT